MGHKTLRSVLIKPAGPDCNLRCSYCFYTEKAAMFGPKSRHRMSGATLEAAIGQVMGQSPESVAISWQGGEPTLMGLHFYEEAVRLERKYGEGKTVGNAFQTNGILIDRRWAQFFRDNEFLVGLSIDGPRHVHDYYRKHLNGSPSWAQVMHGAETLLTSGVAVNAVSTVTRYSGDHPDEVYDFLKGVGFSYMQFIPVVEKLPGGSQVTHYSVSAAQYGEFLNRLFERWQNDFTLDGTGTSVRFFDAVLARYLGLEAAECELSDTCGTYLVIEHNGDVYSCDFFVEPDHRLGSVHSDTLTEMLNSSQQESFGNAKAHLAPVCSECRWLAYCRGGCPKDRLKNPAGDGTSYFCGSYRKFFERADSRFRRMAQELRR